MSQQVNTNDAIVIALTGQKELSSDLEPSKTLIDGKQVVKQVPEIISKDDLLDLASKYHHAARTGSQGEFVAEQREVLLKQREAVIESIQKVNDGSASEETLAKSTQTLDKSRELLNKYLDAHILQKYMEASEINKSMSTQEIQNRVSQTIVENKVPSNSNDMRNGAFVEIMSDYGMQKSMENASSKVNAAER